jgi:UDP-2-acetamido-3-amino-2,3-dideoxy-glucuronate N-acetyltransferase
MVRNDLKDVGVSIAVVGTGYWGKNHVRNFADLGALAQIYDADTTSAEKLAEAYPQIRTANSYEEILCDADIRGIVIATPAATHHGLAMQAIKAGKDVLVEKPMALTVRDGKELVSAAESSGSVLMVGHILLYHPAVLKLKEIINEGHLGKIHYIYSNRLSTGKIRSEENILWSFAPHDISMILYLLDEFPDQISAAGFCHLQKDIEDVTISTFSFPSGVGSHIHVCWMNPFKEHRLVVIGDRKMAVFEDSLSEEKLRIFDCNFEWINRVPLPCKGETAVISIDVAEPLKMECRHFLQCIQTRQRPRSDGHEGLRTLKVLQQCYDSMKSKAPRSHEPHIEQPSQKYFSHPSVVIDQPSSIGDGTQIWHFSHVMQEAAIGANCRIGANVLVGKGVQIGRGCKIQNNVSVYEGVTLEDNVFCGPSMVFTNVFNPRSEIPRMNELRPTLVKQGATVGANATIVCGNTIGRYAFVGAGAVVVKDVEDHALVVGNPARRVGWMCRCGNKLDGVDGDEFFHCPACHDVYSQSRHGGLVKRNESISSVPLLDLKAQYSAIKTEVDAAIARVVETQHFIMGPEVEILEREVAAYCGCNHAIGVSSGSDALLLSLMALGISPGDEVITTPFTFFATAGCIHRLFAKPVFVDIRPDTFNIDPSQIEKHITAKTKAIIPVHLFGQCAEMNPLMELAQSYGIPVVEDAAQAIGSEYYGRRAGSIGNVGCFSFFPSKNLGGFGDGGMITTNDDQLAEKIRVMRNHGAKPKYFHPIVGGNFRLDALQSAILSVKLKYLDSWTEKRISNSEYYTERLSRMVSSRLQLRTPSTNADRHIFNQYVIRVQDRDGLAAWLKSNKIGTEIYYPLPLHLQECFAHFGYQEGDLSESELAAKDVLALPIYAELTREQQDYVVNKIVEYAQE